MSKSSTVIAMSSSDLLPDSFPLPAVRDAITPFLYPRNEILSIRAKINAHVTSVAKSVTSASLSQSRAEKSLTGVRKSYIEALHAHQEALKEYKSVTEKIIPRPVQETKKLPPTTPTRSAFPRDEDEEEEEGREEEEEFLLAHDQVVYLRRRYERLLIAKKYFDKIKQLSSGDDEGNGGRRVGGSIQEIIYDSVSNAPIPPPPTAMTTAAEDILLPLEKAVVSTYELLQKEKNQLRGAKELAAHKSNSNVSPEAKVHALRVVKETLEEWLDAQLKQAGEDAATPKKHRPEDHRGVEDVQKIVEGIQVAYDEYVASREALLVVIHKAYNAENTTRSPTKPSTPFTETRKDDEEPRLALLPYIDRLIATSKASKAAHALSAALAKSIATDAESMSNVIDRLRSESRLLDEYHHPSETGGSNSSWIRQWKYAADENRKGTVEGVRADIKVAEGKLDEAEARLEKVKEAIGEKEGGVLGKMDGNISV